jgi:hypothetical protein
MKRSARIRFSLGMTAALTASAALAACNDMGRIGDGPIGEAAQPQCLSIEPGRAPIRRMTRAEYNNTVRDLLGDTTAPATAFVAEEEALGFNNQATSLGVTQLLAEQLMIAAEKLATAAAADVDERYCLRANLGDEACGKAFIERFGKRAYRRPLTADEATRLYDLFTWGLAEGGRKKGLSLVLQAMLQAPQFLYRVELGMPDPVVGDVVKLTHYEVASRLSYLLWNSMPDDELFELADQGKLGTADEVEAQARRMLDDPRARQAVANFHTQWLKLSHIENVSKSPTTYPAYKDALRPLWKQETEAFLEHVVFDGEGDVATILSAPYSMMNAELAAFYGLESPASGEAFSRVELDSSERAGILTHASLLAVHAKPNQSSPVHRGKFVREMLLCQTLPPPPNNVEIKPPEVKPGATTRERFSQHSKDPDCASCHRLMDPIGFGFEHYDGIGQWRDTDQGLPVDASGEVTGAEEVDGPFNGAVELANKLAESELVRQCVATQWFRFGYGRAEQDDEDQCTMGEIQDAFTASGGNIKDLLIALTQTEAFRFRHRFK